nr:biorientation of chromosomes in cell division protein 1-like 1 isoform X1 [Leptinotarsa decemlineata]
MEVVGNNFMPGDTRLVEQLVYELKSQGIFDRFRKECISDVDTKPAYQNLRQRVEGSVSTFLKQQVWSPDMNKNQVREQLRKNIYESGYLDTGVERIVDQVVNPKINTIFLPEVEDVVYRFLGVVKPVRDVKKDVNVKITDLLPTDLEAVSPDSVHSFKDDVKREVNNDSLNSGSKPDEDESPPFEPLDAANKIGLEENSVDSHLSGFSGLQSHGSNNSSDIKVCQMEISSQDSQVSHNSSESRLSIVTSEDVTKMEVCEDSNSNLTKSTVEKPAPETWNETKMEVDQVAPSDEIDNSLSEDVRTEEVRSFNENDISSKTEDVKVENEKKSGKTDDKKNDKRYDKTNEKKSRSSDKYYSKDKRDDKRKSSSSSKDKSSSKHSSSKESSSRSKEKDKDRSRTESKSSSSTRDKEKNDKSRDKTDRDRSDREKKDKGREKSDKEKGNREKEKEVEKSDKEKPTKEKSEKDKVNAEKSSRDKEKSSKEKNDRHDKEREKSDKDKSHREKDKTDKEKSSKDKDKSSKPKEKSDKPKEKDKYSKEKSSKENSEKDGEKVRGSDSKSSSKDKDRPSSSSRHSDKEKSRSSNSSSSRDKPKLDNGDSKSRSSATDKTRKDGKVSVNGKSSGSSSDSKKDKDKKRDSKKSSKDDHYSSKDKRNDRRSNDRDSNDGRCGKQNSSGSLSENNSSRSEKSSQELTSNSGSGDSGNSDSLERTEPGKSEEVMTATSCNVQRLIKPKFASNFQEARKIMKIRKQLAMLERQKRLGFTQIELLAENGLVKLKKPANQQKLDSKSSGKSEDSREVSLDRTVDVCDEETVTGDPGRKTPDSPLTAKSLKVTELSKENWEALEARLAQEMSNVKYSSYDSDEDMPYPESPKKKESMEVVETVVKEVVVGEAVLEDSQGSNELEDFKGFSEEKSESTSLEFFRNFISHTISQESLVMEKQNDLTKEISQTKRLSIVIDTEEINKNNHKAAEEDLDCSATEDCRYLEKPTALEEANLRFLHEFVDKLQREVYVCTKVTKNNVQHTRRGRKRKANEIVDVKNNNDAHYKQIIVRKRGRPPGSQTVLSKVDKEKLCNNTDILSHDRFPLPLSPAESDKSNDKKEEEIVIPAKRRRIIAAQRYSSDDLYKPRPVFCRRNKDARKS